jgi:hypothetical protein
LVAFTKSPEGRAVSYTLKNWTARTRYCKDGGLHIHNNATERAIRGVAVAEAAGCSSAATAAPEHPPCCAALSLHASGPASNHSPGSRMPGMDENSFRTVIRVRIANFHALIVRLTLVARR